jgi:glucose/arabinose dehydrogenase
MIALKYSVGGLVLFLCLLSAAGAHVAADPAILQSLGLHEGEIVGSTDPADPDIYIINAWGYKRLFLSPAIFSFYGHLRYDSVKRFPDTVIASMPISALFQNCESGAPQVYALEVTAEDTAVLHWVNVSGDAAVAEDPDFFKRIFCINNREFSWYAKGAAYTTLAQIPLYERAPSLNGTNTTTIPLTLPAGFHISLFAQVDGPPRFMAVSPDGIVFASMPSPAGLYGGSGLSDGKVFAFPDANRDGRADEVRTVLSGLRLPHGLAFFGGYLYVAEEGVIARYPYTSGGIVGARQVIATLPTGGEHLSRTIGFSPSGKLYVSVGSQCNNCTTGNTGTAVIWEFNADGTGGRVFARGVRNAVGLVFHPTTGEIWATENGRDFLGDDLPPDEINIIRDGRHYGWPYCYGAQVRDPGYPQYDCSSTESSVHGTQAHSAPLGLRFVTSAQFPNDWQGDIIVARHGSWNRPQPVGYDVIRLRVEGNTVIGEEPFITGWLTANNQKLGRPVDVIFGGDGALYLSDDKANVIYRVTKAP